MPDPKIAASPVFPDIEQSSRLGRPDGPAGVIVTVREYASCIQASPWRGQRDHTARALQSRFGVLPAATPGVIQGSDNVIIMWDGPEGWLVLDRTAAITCKSLIEELDGRCAVVDQSDGRALIELSGPHARDVLAKGMEPDFHDKAFPIGAAAIGKLCHLVCHVWRLDDHFGLLVPRSTAGDVWHWLVESGREFGIEIR